MSGGHGKDDKRLPRILSPEAKRDLLDIWQFVSATSSSAIAEKLLREIERAAYYLGGYTALGKPRDEIRTGLRSWAVERYVMFYRVTAEAVEIVRVVDERRDVEIIFDDEQ
jgi:toxin ParE1/3/4